MYYVVETTTEHECFESLVMAERRFLELRDEKRWPWMSVFPSPGEGWS